MNLSEFKRSFRRGLGSAIVELKNTSNPSQYRNVIMWCCLHDMSFDCQCEGTKGYYLYDAICAIDEKRELEEIIIDKFLSPCRDNLFLQLGDILTRYSEDGSEKAREAFYKKHSLFSSKQGHLSKCLGRCDEGFQWEDVAERLYDIDGFFAFKRYAYDVGEILMNNPRNSVIYYEAFISRAGDKFGKAVLQVF